ncbi:glycoside hydrolase [Flammula alnicola]|nr:glycoside hydrolase [Flammula alnicola]
MGNDEYHPLSKKGSNLTDEGGIGYTVVDSIDTMQIMGLEEEYKRTRDWVANTVNEVTQTTIRVLGGLLMAYHPSNEDPILEKATELADRMLPVFDTPSGLPLSMIIPKQRKGVDDLNNDDYCDKAEQVMRVIKAAKLSSVLVPIYLRLISSPQTVEQVNVSFSAETGQFLLSEIRLGSRGDSYYEYLLKQYLETNKSERVYLEMYEETMEAIHKTLVHKGLHEGLIFTTEFVPKRRRDGQVSWRLYPKQDHLVCFLGGSLMLGTTTTGAAGSSVSVPPWPSELTSAGQRDWKLGYELIETLDSRQEITHFWTKDDVNVPSLNPTQLSSIPIPSSPEQPSYDARYLLRSGTVESLFIAYRLAGNVNPKYRDGGYASILNVDGVRSIHIDKMETFFLSETIKYLYFLFSDASVIPLDAINLVFFIKYVFNTEAHPLLIFTPSTRTGFF